ncbi:GH36-type glycosyl hydrolase domain-containing protein [Pantoea agglomerans]|uniref:GH36-type glycosyl hydrolase domain-containing protein n=1 Tax=Enterobacter agglomerans TaxID=549 RepID=UPI0013C644F3|nr:glucoamylase family protein [Pantoea agglomerans]NEG79524.1 cyclic beta 1-2 glucan synthetase [Pantoea agglomerans]
MKIKLTTWFSRESELPDEHFPLFPTEGIYQAHRPDIFSAEQMDNYGEKLAKTHNLSGGKWSYRLLQQLADNELSLTRSAEILSEGDKRSQTPAAVWILDNFYIIEEQIRLVRHLLPAKFGKGLPMLEESAHYLRIQAIAEEMIKHSDGRLETSVLHPFIAAYQRVTPLLLGELWAMPAMLRFALINNLARIAADVARVHQERNKAEQWISDILSTAAEDASKVILVIADMARQNPQVSGAFVAELERRLSGQNNTLALTWVEQQLENTGRKTSEVIEQFNRQLALSQLSVSNSITGLRQLGEIDWQAFVESVSLVEKVLQQDPTGTYPLMHFDSRDDYRHVIERLARHSRFDEREVAQAVLTLASQPDLPLRQQHVGYYLLDKGFQQLEQQLDVKVTWLNRSRQHLSQTPLLSWLGSLLLLTTAFTAEMLYSTHQAGMASLLWLLVLPAIIVSSQLALQLLSELTTRSRHPLPLPRLDYAQAVPEHDRTLVVIPCLLSSNEGTDALLRSLEICYLGNALANISFALLTDFTDSAEQDHHHDAALIRYAVLKTEALNRRYSGGKSDIALFSLLHRDRTHNISQGVWMGYERKRGKIHALNRWLQGEENAFSVTVGATQTQLHSVKYVITLDSDTILPRETAHKLIGVMAHPLNAPVFDDVKNRVVEGYAILQPRLAEEIPVNGQSRYARLCSSIPGNDAYSSLSSDIYQDLFGEGSFVGKGIYDVAAFSRAIRNTCPENLVLSHDLLEGCYARSGVVSNVVLYEQYPDSYLSDVARRFRWVRGDWQLLNWLRLQVRQEDCSRQKNPLSALSRWKLTDNLRRSLVAPALLMLVFMLCTIVPNPIFWVGCIMLFLLLPGLPALVIDGVTKSKTRAWRQHLSMLVTDAFNRLSRAGLALAILPHESYWSLKAIIVTLWRLTISHRFLNEWKSASSQKPVEPDVRHFYRRMWINPVAGAALVFLTSLSMPSMTHVALALALLWAVAPALLSRMSQPKRAQPGSLSAEQRLFLRRTARKTWAWFNEFASSDNNHLPPDNLQEIPESRVANRTSPTNIGLSLLANLTAWDFGYISQNRVISRTLDTLDTLDRMEHFRGHLYNWYDTQTLKPLNPRYVSTVDSGNMAAHLVTLQAGLAQWKYQPVMSLPCILEGLSDTFSLLKDQLSDTRSDIVEQIDAQLSLMQRASPVDFHAGMQALLALSVLAEQAYLPTTRVNWPALFHQQLVDFTQEWSLLFSWVSPDAPLPADIPSLLWLAELNLNRPGLPEKQAETAIWAARERMAALLELDSRLSDHASMDFRFLYYPATSLLSVGYNMDSGLLDASKYDLFPSEVRLTHYFAISTSQLPAKSWFVLGRLFTQLNNQPAVMSWSGSMFEYLMPHLVMPVYPDTLLEKMALSAVRQQIASGNSTDTPWGVSESGYAAFDVNHNYQYRAFGTPELGLKRGLNDNHVVAPYATLLALMVLPQEATANLIRLKKMGASGDYGYYEALDFTADRLAPGQPFAIVKSYMAHHQAMGLLALSHQLLDAPMVARFMSSALFQSSRLLLQEKVPDDIELYTPRRSFVENSDPKQQRSIPDQREFSGSDPRQPQLQLLSNADYHLMVTHAGTGYSQWKGLALTRWRADSTSNNYGTFCYVTDQQSAEVIAHSYQPTCCERPHYKTRFNDAGIEFDASGTTFSIHTHIVVSPEDDVEIRRITVTNRSRQTRPFDITSYTEVVLAPAASDMAHPAFSNLFVQTEIVDRLEAILAHRRPREENEVTAWMFHAMAIHGNTGRQTSFETDRARFLGRGRTPADAQALMPGSELTGQQGAVLDPVLSIRQSVTLKAGETVTIDMLYGVTLQRDTTIALIEKYRNHISADRVFELAWSHSQVALRQLNIRTEDTSLFNQLASAVLFSSAEMRGESDALMQNRLGQESLWRHAISGDLPILLVRIENINQLDLVTTLIQAHQYWRQKGLTVDLLILNSDQGGYQQNLFNQLTTLIPAGDERQQADKPGGIFIRKSESFSADDLQLLLSVAAVVLEGRNGSLADQLSTLLKPVRTPPAFAFPSVSKTPPPAAVTFSPERLQFFNGTGGFNENGSEYHIILSGQQQTPAPWCNVLANSQLGTVISESGQGYSWYENAHEYRLTPWHNDPVSDSSGEALYLRDEETGDVWSPTPLPVRGKGDYLTRHGFGYSTFEHTEYGISSTLTVFVAEEAPVRLSLLTLSNLSGKTRNLSITGYVEWVLGELASRSARHVVTSPAAIATGSAVLARNFYNSTGSARTAFFAVTGTRIAYSGNRLECLGRNGTTRQPAMMNVRGLSGNTGAGMDPCAALQTLTTLIDGDSRSFVFALGVGEDEGAVTALMQQFLSTGEAQNELARVKQHWHQLLTKVQIQTPATEVDLLANGWLLYQTLASRLLARSGYYQSGGAFGFRDQLQDTLALTHAAPQRLRDQLLLCASRQFIEGDVQHWWHPPAGRGVRTRCSDDYLWLPYALCRYVQATDDIALLSQPVSYLEGRLLAEDEESVYELPGVSKINEPLWQHCVRAVNHALTFGQHGLPLMGSGDWNDGMSTVGIAGKGESVWLGFFLYTVLDRFAALAVRFGDTDTARHCQEHAQTLKTALNHAAWDGEWYLRGFFDSGQTLGSHADSECRIDAIAQSWSVLSGAGEDARCRSAMEALYQHLVDKDNRLIKLLTPPFDGAGPNPGYIRGYLPGVRENGGQYTHGALWAIMAFAAMGETERAWSLLSMINPVNHSGNQQDMAIYKAEPYVMAADVYAAEGHSGRGGWTWYTGSSGWTYQLISESLLGITRRGNALSVRPQLPADWSEIKIVYRDGEGIYNIRVTRGDSIYQLWLDGKRCDGDEIALESHRQEHQVEVWLGSASG